MHSGFFKIASGKILSGFHLVKNLALAADMLLRLSLL
jgi:hypothetical protein